MTTYITSDVHLRLDQPERSRRFAEWVASRTDADAILIAGDLCDFWFAARQRNRPLEDCSGLQALRTFGRAGGDVIVLLGNHDTWMGPYYRERLEATVVPEPYCIECDGVRLHLVHGHRLGGHSFFKTLLEGRAVLWGFGMLPDALALWCENRLIASNAKGFEAETRKQLAMYREYTQQIGEPIDLALFGHVHQTLNQSDGVPPMIVIGSWLYSTPYLRLEAGRVSFHVEDHPQLRIQAQRP